MISKNFTKINVLHFPMVIPALIVNDKKLLNRYVGQYIELTNLNHTHSHKAYIMEIYF